jgi:predicted RNase H-like HicB family nuclease
MKLIYFVYSIVMLTRYLHNMVRYITYTIDDDGMIIASIVDEQGYYAQGESHEEARDNLLDVMEMLMLDKIQS